MELCSIRVRVVPVLIVTEATAIAIVRKAVQTDVKLVFILQSLGVIYLVGTNIVVFVS